MNENKMHLSDLFSFVKMENKTKKQLYFFFRDVSNRRCITRQQYIKIVSRIRTNEEKKNLKYIQEKSSLITMKSVEDENNINSLVTYQLNVNNMLLRESPCWNFHQSRHVLFLTWITSPVLKLWDLQPPDN